jgi:hypothetical protein
MQSGSAIQNINCLPSDSFSHDFLLGFLALHQNLPIFRRHLVKSETISPLLKFAALKVRLLAMIDTVIEVSSTLRHLLSRSGGGANLWTGPIHV